MMEDFGWRDFLAWHLADIIVGGVIAAGVLGGLAWFLSGHLRIGWVW